LENDKQPTEQPTDRFSRLMFGTFPSRERIEKTSSPQQELDWIQLMQDIDTLVSSFQRLKPFMRNMTSFVDLFKK